jgi:hypothetical protein
MLYNLLKKVNEYKKIPSQQFTPQKIEIKCNGPTPSLVTTMTD